MKITDKVKSFEAACSLLGLDPKALPVVDHLPEKDRDSIVAYYKLTVITRALNQGWEPNWNDWGEYKYFNWFYTDSAGFSCADAPYAATRAGVNVGSRICFKNAALANYARDTFADLYRELLYIDQPKVRKK